MCYLSDVDTLLVSSGKWAPEFRKWLLALKRSGRQWKEAARSVTSGVGNIICELKDQSQSQVLVGQKDSTYMELFSVDSDSHIRRQHKIQVRDIFSTFVATRSTPDSGGVADTLVAMSLNEKHTILLGRLVVNRLEDLLRIQMDRHIVHLLWPSSTDTSRLLAAEFDAAKNSHAIEELDLSGKPLVRGYVLLQHSDNVNLSCWGTIDNGIALYDSNSKQLRLYSTR